MMTAKQRRVDLPRSLLSAGFDAIKYEGNSLKPNDNYSHNLAVIKNPEQLKPIGVYPVTTTRDVPISIPTIRTIQAAGIAGTVVAVGYAGKQIIESSDPLVETAHQTALLTAATTGGALAGKAAILPCGSLGVAFPVAAPITVPSCIALASLAGGTAAAAAVDVTWKISEQPHKPYKPDPSNLVTNVPTFGPVTFTPAPHSQRAATTSDVRRSKETVGKSSHGMFSSGRSISASTAEHTQRNHAPSFISRTGW